MSDTPKTEEAKFSGIHPHPSEEYVDADFARALELELNEQAVENGKGGEREAALLGKVDRLELENARLRAIFPKILEALQSGACSPDCSIEFMQQIPDEVRLVVGRLCLQIR